MIDPATSKAPPGYYNSDLAYCQNLADQVPSANEAAGRGLAGAALGAVAGGIIGSLSGNFGTGLAAGAGLGAASGIASGGISAEQEKRQVINNCMRNRGYSVLN
ncbi:glycine zipper domain-containing protein [Zavarzinia compransoris]|uniref:glycine zipper domain-containing protein n=1 Tax=Zavarzinia compransoris TaxID=1264899 RepID=UPI001AAD9075|nr:glycine zipper domain-containing protein [Zavarzinia compransoris]